MAYSHNCYIAKPCAIIYQWIRLVLEEDMKVGVYGLGRFGAFWAKTLADAGCTVLAYSRSSHEVDGRVSKVSEDELLKCPYIFFCVAISRFEEVLERTAPRMDPSSVVIDTCSVKTYPAKWMREKLHPGQVAIATHPMFGPDSGKNGVEGLPVVLCRISDEDEHYSKVRDLFVSMGLHVLEMSPMEHDREAAYSQGVTHFVGRTLKEMGLEDTEIATKGYKSLMSIVEQTCNDPMQLFCDLQRYNPYAKEMRLSLQVAIEKVLNRLMMEEM